MKLLSSNARLCLIGGAALIAGAALAKADDHLFNASQHGLSLDGQPYQTNPAGNGGDLAPGQGSPFTGEEPRRPPPTRTLPISMPR